MAPVVNLLKNDEAFTSYVCVTGQHRSMLDQVLSLFDVKSDFDLSVMESNQTLNSLCCRIIAGLNDVLADVLPDYVLVHGDTTSAMAASLAAFNLGIPIGHVEAGLRTYDLTKPWPEEMNRRVIDTVSTLKFAPTQACADNLSAERLGGRTLITGNTVIDALNDTIRIIRSEPRLVKTLEKKFSFIQPDKRTILVTGHRRESFGEGFVDICKALAYLANRPDLQIVYPVHLNPKVSGPVNELLGKLPSVHLIEPQSYMDFVYLMQRSDIILTDSGGVQEEAPSLGKPVLVMRDVTERPEAVAAGTVKLVGTKPKQIIADVSRLLDDLHYYQSVARAVNPYGDGKAAQRIADALAERNFMPFISN